MVLNFRTGFVTHTGEEVMDGSSVAWNYLRGWFAIDLLSSVPFDFLFEGFATGFAGAAGSARLLKAGKAMKVLKMARLSKLMKMSNSQYADAIEEMRASSSFMWLVTLGKLTAIAYFMCHVIGCLWAWASYQEGTSWMDGYTDGYGEQNGSEDAATWWPLKRRYILCM